MAEHAELANGHENDALLPQGKQNNAQNHTYSSFRDVSGAPDLSASVNSLPLRDADEYMKITKWRAFFIILSLGVLVLIQGTLFFICT